MSRERLITVDLAKKAGLPIHRFPTTSEEAAIAEDALARELRDLTLDEQEKIIFDIHGIRTTTPHDESTLAAALEELQHEIDKITKKEAYEQAVFMNESYVKDPKFCLLFLRALEYNSAAAADMMVQHFATKRLLFGNGEVLGREIRQSDLTPKDIEIINNGFMQVLPTRDTSGRAIMSINAEIPYLDTPELLVSVQCFCGSFSATVVWAIKLTVECQWLVFICISEPRCLLPGYGHVAGRRSPTERVCIYYL